MRPFSSLSTRVLYYLLTGSLVFAFLFPIGWSFLGTLKTRAEASASPPTLWPSQFSIENYLSLLEFNSGLMQYMGNSLMVASGTVVFTSILATLAGFGFARFKFKGREVMFFFILSAMMIPFQSILLPLFLLLKELRLLNSHLGLILVYTTFQLPFSVFLMRNNFEAIPMALEESARLDNCGSIKMLWYVMLPLARPAIISVCLFTFLNAWNEFIAALIFITTDDKFTLPVMLTTVTKLKYFGIDWGALQAGVIVSMLPCILLFVLLQRYYVAGLMGGAVKG